MGDRQARRKFEKAWSDKYWWNWLSFLVYTYNGQFNGARYSGEEMDAAVSLMILDLESITMRETGVKYVAQLNCWDCTEIWVGPTGPGSGKCPSCGSLYCEWINADEIIQASIKERENGGERT